MIVAIMTTALAGTVKADTYEQLTSIANIDESAEYVLGIDGTGFHYEGTSSWGKTALPSAHVPIKYTLTKASDGNSFTAQATISGTTYYLQIPTSNTFSMATSAGTNTDIIIGTTQVSGTNYAVANKTTTTRHLRINGTSGLRSYAGTTGTMAFFYKVVSDGVVNTTTAINVPEGFNRDVHTSNTAGQLTATVTANGSPISGATVSWESSNINVATIDQNGNVTLVAEGTTTITATYAGVTGQYNGSSATYTLNVTDSTPFAGGDVTFDATIDKGTSPLTKKGVEFACSNGDLNSYPEYRLYKNSETTFSVPDNYYITQIVFTDAEENDHHCSNLNRKNGTAGTYNQETNTWTGASKTVVFVASDQARASQITVTVASGEIPPTPTNYTVTFNVGNGTFVSNTDFPSTSNTKAAGTYTLPSATPATGYTFDGWLATGTTTPVTGEYIVSGDVDFTAQYTQNTPPMPSGSFNVDFESAASTYSYWTFTNMESQKTGSITAHNGTYYGTTGGKTTASIQTKTAINPGSFTCYVSKQSTNTTSSTWYIQVSEDGSTWTDAETRSATDMSKGAWVEFTADLSSYTNVYVRLYYSGSTAIRNVDDIVLTMESSVASPVISLESGAYEETQSVTITAEAGASIYYTLDGSTPTSESTAYTGAISITESCTLKAIAIVGGESSNVASATYTINLPLTTIAQVKTLTDGTTFKLNLTNAQVVFVDGDHIYVRDNSGAIEFYQSEISLSTGDLFDATIAGTYTLYNGQPEITEFTQKVITVNGNETVLPTIISTLAEAQANVCDLVKFANVQLTEDNGKYYIGETGIQLYDKFHLNYSPESERDVDVAGIVILYQKNNTGDITTEVCPRYESDIVYLDNSEAVSISSTTGYSTYCSNNNLDFTAVDAIKVFYATVDGSTLTFHRIYKVAAGTGVLLASATGGAVAATNVPFFTGDADATTSNVFVRGTGAAVNYTDENQNYVLSIVNDVVGFYRAKNNPVATNRAYIHVPEGVGGVKVFSINLDDDATGISNLNVNDNLNGAIYNVAGQRLQKMQKGINIVNGKKILK